MSYEKDLDVLMERCMAQLRTKCQEMQTQEGLNLQAEVDEVIGEAFEAAVLIFEREIPKP